jgi:hypothetical protein
MSGGLGGLLGWVWAGGGMLVSMHGGCDRWCRATYLPSARS